MSSSSLLFSLGLVGAASTSQLYAAATVITQDGVEYVQEWEHLDAGEGDTSKALAQTLQQVITSGQKANGGRMLRDAHPKAHGCVVAKFTVDPALPSQLQTPVLQPGRSYDAIIRFSSGSGKVQADSLPDARGLAIKLFDVSAGPKLAPTPAGATTQDFVMVSFPIFVSTNVGDFNTFVSNIQNPKKYYLPKLDPATWLVPQFAAQAAFAGKSDASLLQHRYFSQVPALLNDRPIKYSMAPCSNDAATRSANPDDNFLRAELSSYLGANTGCFDFEVQQYQTGFEIENGMGWWPAGLDSDLEPPVLSQISHGTKPKSPFNKVARVTIPPQTFDTANKNIYCDNLSFQPWHTIAEHRPLGGINRARRVVYKTISDARHAFNGVAPQEPAGVAEYQGVQ